MSYTSYMSCMIYMSAVGQTLARGPTTELYIRCLWVPRRPDHELYELRELHERSGPDTRTGPTALIPPREMRAAVRQVGCTNRRTPSPRSLHSPRPPLSPLPPSPALSTTSARTTRVDGGQGEEGEGGGHCELTPTLAPSATRGKRVGDLRLTPFFFGRVNTVRRGTLFDTGTSSRGG